MVTPRRWHLYLVDLEPRVGTKPGTQRPCVAIQPDPFGEAGLASTVVLPVTSKVVPDAFPLRVRLPKGTCGLRMHSDILVDQILAWDNALFGRDLGEVPEAIQREVQDALRDFLDL